MIETTMTRTFTLAGCIPAGKPGYAHQARERRSLSTRSSQQFALRWLALALGAVAMAHAQAPAVTDTVLHTFTFPSPQGANPQSGLIRDAAGNLYGTTQLGGDMNGCSGDGCGVVYKVNRAGNLTVLYSFTGGTDGASPSYSGVVRDEAGNLYGTTSSGGTVGWGTVYKLDTAGYLKVLYSFTGGADGGYPTNVIRDAAGNLYGTTFYGGSVFGSSGAGVVYKVDRTGRQTVLHTFTGGADGGYFPNGVIRDEGGNLYGTTYGGGNLAASPCIGFGCGVVYKLDPAGNETVLYAFTGGTDGSEPVGGVVHDSAGNLYGTTGNGGDLDACSGYGCGVVYKLNGSGHETVLYAFTGESDGAFPFGVIRDPAGNLYGTTSNGGDLNVCVGSGCGVVYRVDTSGKETALYTFTGAADGSLPQSGVIGDAAGDLYGTTYMGGTGGAGVVYKLSRSMP
jgi:uncharacterized repeat protein (TIGR03803 family)